MSKASKILVLILVFIFTVSAIKIKYGGEITIKLNPPPSYDFTPSDYSNLIFYSLLYENLFYLKENGEIFSHLFSDYRYDKSTKTLIMTLKDNLSFSNGDPITEKEIKNSVRVFLDMNLSSARRLRSIIKTINTREYQVSIEFLYDTPDAISLMTAPELALISGSTRAYSGMFYPAERAGDQYILLKPNKYYAGGRTYLDTVKVIFSGQVYPDVFISRPEQVIPNYQAFDAGIYQNIYIVFPQEQVGQNIRVALYSLLRGFYQSPHVIALNAYTSNEESPISLHIKIFSDAQIRKILQYSTIKLYVSNSLISMEKDFQAFVQKKEIPIETVYLDDNMLESFMSNTSIEYLLLAKVFTKRMPIEEKIKKIVKEMSFTRFNEKYLKLINELDEVGLLKNEELLIDHVAKIMEQIGNDGFILPLFQTRYAVYANGKLQGIEMDNYGRPLFQGVKLK